MKKILIFGIVALIVIIIIASGCLEKKNVGNNFPVPAIEPIEKVIKDTGIGYNFTYFGNIQKNSEIQFKVGDKFLYRTEGDLGGYSNITYFVEEIKKVDGRECYVVSETDSSIYIEAEGWPPQYFSRTITLCYDKETGRVLRVTLRENNEEFIIEDGANELRAMHSFFAYWMLGLSDDAKWEILFTQITPSLNLTEYHKAEFRVLGREKVNDRECFKVELRYVELLDKKEVVTSIDYYYVDVKKRIVVRWARYSVDKLKYSEMNFISEL